MRWNISASRLSAYWRNIFHFVPLRGGPCSVLAPISPADRTWMPLPRTIIARVPFLDRRVRAVIRAEREDRYQAIPVRATRVGAADLTPQGASGLFGPR